MLFRSQAFTWVAQPRPGKHTIERPFAFALIRPDGADTAMLHMVDCGSADAITIGSRVAPRWRAERTGYMTDIEAWVPLADGEQAVPAPVHVPAEGEEDVTGITVPVALRFVNTAGESTTRYLLGMAEGKIIGARAPHSTDVYEIGRAHV